MRQVQYREENYRAFGCEDMTASEQAIHIKQLVNMADVLFRYGFEVNSKGFMKCPFHASGNEKTPSFQLRKSNTFRCYGCDASGSVIDFVMRLFNISFVQAILRINYDFNLNLSNERPNAHSIAKIQHERAAIQKEIQDYRAEYMANIMRFRAMRELAEQYKPIDENIRPIYFMAIAEMEYLDYWFLINCWR